MKRSSCLVLLATLALSSAQQRAGITPNRLHPVLTCPRCGMRGLRRVGYTKLARFAQNRLPDPELSTQKQQQTLIRY
jgi:hypothetical protein